MEQFIALIESIFTKIMDLIQSILDKTVEPKA